MSAGLIRRAFYGAGLIAMILSVHVGVAASGVIAPEIDGSSLTAGLGLLTAAVLIVRSRSRK
jgi:hypothetical protein